MIDLNDARICIIDDDRNVVRTVERILNSRGFKTLGLSQAVGSSSRINRFNPHIIIVDLNMPAISGEDLIGVFKKTLRTVPKVIIFSGIEPRRLAKIAEQMGADDFLYKGDGLFQLLSKVNIMVSSCFKECHGDKGEVQ